MSQHSKFSCKICGAEVTFDVPDIESPFSFGDKVPCSSCGQVGCTYWGPA